ncbi:MAG: HesA/MoeB/ThiF family protein [Verrucomicrobiae bacterium]|nr:HesA/MoeB/ThiF family protein [Verrucomicrobiae bacterium]
MECPPPSDLTEHDRARYEWQMWVEGFGEIGQRRLKAATAFVSRVGGVGGTAAYYLAAAGIGRLILAHGGNVQPSDLNRQLLMTHDWLGKPRMESAVRRLRELNPSVEVTGIPENVSQENIARLAAGADIIIDAAPLFAERHAMNRESVRLRIPMVECSMYEWEAHLTIFIPGETPCLSCLYPEDPAHWRRQFPVLGAVSGTVGAMAAAEAIKYLAGLGHNLAGSLLSIDLGSMQFRRLAIRRDPACLVCADTTH